MPPDCSREQGDWLRGAAERAQVLPGLVRSEKKKSDVKQQECRVQTSVRAAPLSDTQAEWVEITLDVKAETSQQPVDTEN